MGCCCVLGLHGMVMFHALYLMFRQNGRSAISNSSLTFCTVVCEMVTSVSELCCASAMCYPISSPILYVHSSFRWLSCLSYPRTTYSNRHKVSRTHRGFRWRCVVLVTWSCLLQCIEFSTDTVLIWTVVLFVHRRNVVLWPSLFSSYRVCRVASWRSRVTVLLECVC